jgi:hypothetical protein
LQLDFEALLVCQRHQRTLHALERVIGLQSELLFRH